MPTDSRRRRGATPQGAPRIFDAAALRALPIDPETWELAVGPLDWIEDGHAIVLGYASVVVDRQGIVRQHSLKAGRPQGTDEVLECLYEAMLGPMPPAAPSRPMAVRMENPELASALRERLGFLGTRVERGESSEALNVLALMRQHSIQSRAVAFFSSCSAADVLAFFESAKEFYAAEPWRYFSGRKYLAFRVGGGPWAYANIMGQSGEVYGLSVFEHWLTLCRFVSNVASFGNAGARGRAPKALRTVGSLEGLSLTPLHALHPEDADYLLRLGIKPLADELYPLPHAYSADAQGALPPRLPLPAYTSLIGGISRILADHGGRTPEIVEIRYDLGGGQVELRYPARGDEDLPANPGRYRVAVARKGKPLDVHVRGNMKVNDLALEMTQRPTGPPAWAVGQGAFCLWREDNDEDEPVPRIHHLRGLQSLWIKIGATRCPMQVDACVAE